MQIVFISDLHLLTENPVARLDNLPDTQLNKLTYLLDYASDNNNSVIIAGDVFDRPRSWYLLPDIIDILNKYKNVPIYCVYGQHDTYFYHEDTKQATSLGVLWKSGLITLLDKTPEIVDNVHIYGASITQQVPDVIDETKTNILVIHAPIAEEALFPSHDYLDAKKFLDKNSKYDIILCGDIHRKFLIPSDDKCRVILNTGPVLRKEGNEYNMTHVPGFYVIDKETNKIKFEELPHENAEDVLTRDHIIGKKGREESFGKFVDALNTKEVKKGINIKKSVQQFAEENKVSSDVKDILAKKMSKEKK